MEAVTPIPKIRAGNEFTFIWSISRDGVAEDLTDINITDLKLTVCVGGLCAERSEVPFTIVDTNKVRSQHLYERTGTYNLELTYKKAGVENEIDIEAFKIVARSAEASDSSDFIVSSDMAIGFKGDKGDPFTYDDFTPEQITELQQPATDAIASIQEVELAVETAEGLRQQAEINRQSDTATAIFNAEQATDDANDAALLANEKAGLANEKALLADEKAGLAETATTQANAARDGANNAAQSATNLVNSYATDIAAKELKANKQNSLAVDGTGTKFPTVDAVNEGLGAKANVVQEAWIEPTLLNGWTNAGSGVKYKKDSFGVVRLDIATGQGTGPIFTLPVGYRPNKTLDFASNSGGGFGIIRVTTAGVVSRLIGSGTYILGFGLTFVAE